VCDRPVVSAPTDETARERLAADMYWALKRRPLEGTASAAVQAHSQACGVVGWLLDWHPDRVARAVALLARREARDDG